MQYAGSMAHPVLRAPAVTLLLAVAGLLAGGVVPGVAFVHEPVWADEDEVEFVPHVRLPTIDGEMAATFDFRGKRLLLIEFASW